MYNACDLTPTTMGARQPPLRVRRNIHAGIYVEIHIGNACFLCIHVSPSSSCWLNPMFQFGSKAICLGKNGQFPAQWRATQERFLKKAAI